MAFERDPNEIGALWMKSGAKGDYMTGTIAGEKVVVFKAKKTNDKSPDWRVLKSKPRDTGAPVAPITDEDIPF